jgi:hypothetical protein
MQLTPALAVSAMKAWLTVFRSGRPKDTFLAPRLILTPNPLPNNSMEVSVIWLAF